MNNKLISDIFINKGEMINEYTFTYWNNNCRYCNLFDYKRNKQIKAPDKKEHYRRNDRLRRFDSCKSFNTVDKRFRTNQYYVGAGCGNRRTSRGYSYSSV